VSQVSEAELREWEAGQEAEELGAGGNHHCSFPRLTSWRPQERVRRFHVSFLFVIHFIFLVRIAFSRDRPGRRAKGNLQRAATAPRADKKQDWMYITPL